MIKITGLSILISILAFILTGFPIYATIMPILSILLLLIGIIRLTYIKRGV